MWEEDVRIISGEMKFFDTNRTGNGEGKPLCTNSYFLDKNLILLSLDF